MPERRIENVLELMGLDQPGVRVLTPRQVCDNSLIDEVLRDTW